MTDHFYPLALPQLLSRIIGEIDSKEEVFGHSKELIVIPVFFPELKTTRFGQTLSTPYGVAAGPHTQMAQNIVSAWLFGARYIELKTVQTLDQLTLSKPCIDMQDEGYNCEWSQELKIQQSFDEYLNAWIIIHVLNHKFDWGKNVDTIFNMSVGYNLEGILQENIQWFFEKMNNCATELNEKKNQIRAIYPQIDEIEIPTQLSNNITLSTMHGCPANEIEEIALYLIEKKKLHTTVKLNPTLLGPEKLRFILNTKLEWPVQVPDLAFEHDLKYNDAISIIRNLENAAQKNNVHFGLKLTNTLEVMNQKTVFDPKETMMYLSGRALHPISINVAALLQKEFNGLLDISFSAGIDAFNISDVLACGFQPITVSTDLLKPGGYSRMAQYAKNIQHYLKAENRISLPSAKTESPQLLLNRLELYAQNAIENKAYKYQVFEQKNIKTQRPLNSFDCTAAPCVDTCPTNQNIPDYLHFAAQGDFQKSFEVILRNNAFPQTLGLVCEHTCQTKCTRINYDNAIQIREIKNFVSQHGNADFLKVPESNGLKISIVGAGPAGLAAAYFLRLEGFEVEIYEREKSAGGMVHKAIPHFRMPNNALYEDIARIEKLGVRINFDTPVDQRLFDELKQKSDYIFLATGAQKMKKLAIPGADSSRVLDPLKFLSDFKQQQNPLLGEKVIVVGGGNTAMDVARAAKKLQNGVGKVTIVYRRALAQMPADAEEIMGAKEEGIAFLNLLSPVRISQSENSLFLLCKPMQLSEKRDQDGRLKVVESNKNTISLEATTIIAAIGQDVVFDFEDDDLAHLLENPKSLRSGKVFLGGDARHGAASIVQAVGDGQQMAKEIVALAKLEHQFSFPSEEKNISNLQHLQKRAERIFGQENHALIAKAEQIMEEAARCLACDEYCNICVSVCPNRANFNYEAIPQKIEMFKLEVNSGGFRLIPDHDFVIAQKQQILNIADFCNECGNCTTFCPTAGEPYRDKPHVYLTKESFAQNVEGYFLEMHDAEFVLNYKNDHERYSLSETKQNFIFDSAALEIRFTKEHFSIEEIHLKQDEEQIISLRKAAEMRFVLEGAKKLAY